MTGLLKRFLLGMEISALSAVFIPQAHPSEFPVQSQVAGSTVGATEVPELVSAYLVAKGGQSSMIEGGTLQFTAYGIYADGSVGALPDSQGNAVTLWNTSNHEIARVSTMGHATAVGAGIVEIEGMIGALKASPWAVTVTSAAGLLPLALKCSANPPAIYQGDSTTITAATSTQTSPLVYSYLASAGSISGTAASETLNTGGAAAGVINVTCSATQAGAGMASATANVILWPQSLGGDITVTSPTTGSTVAFPAWIKAQNTGCYGLQPVYFGYSIDHGSPFVPAVTASELDTPDPTMDAGIHTIYFKSWTAAGECPTVYSTFTVTGTAGVGDTIPSNAASSGDLDGADGWAWVHDAGTPGTSSGSSLYPLTGLTLDNTARAFYVTYSDAGGERYHLSFGTDATATHFVYDTYIYLADSSQVQNIELDVNQVMPNGQTVILGTQCSSNSGTWEYTTVTGGAHWNASKIPCNPRQWSANMWHHVQIASHHDAAGVATYDWVDLDGTISNFDGASGPSALSLGWAAGDLVLNFQLDGAGSGSVTAYVDKLAIYRW